MTIPGSSVCAQVVTRATGRAVCTAFSQALQRYGVPTEVLTDNGKQFTGKFGGPARRWRCCSTGSAGTTASLIG